MTKAKNTIVLGLAGLTAAASVLVGTTAGAPEAAAQVAAGDYTYTTFTQTQVGSVPSSSRAVVRGNTLLSYPTIPFGKPIPMHIYPTAQGGYIEMHGTRFVLNRQGHGRYAGPAYMDGKLIGRNTLVPRHR